MRLLAATVRESMRMKKTLKIVRKLSVIKGLSRRSSKLGQSMA